MKKEYITPSQKCVTSMVEPTDGGIAKLQRRNEIRPNQTCHRDRGYLKAPHSVGHHMGRH